MSEGTIGPMDEWKVLEVFDVLSAHDQECLITNGPQTAIGIFSCSELVEIKDIEAVKE